MTSFMKSMLDPNDHSLIINISQPLKTKCAHNQRNYKKYIGNIPALTTISDLVYSKVIFKNNQLA